MKAGVIVLLLAGVAHADPAHDLAARAQAHFTLGEYADAVADYRAAYQLVPSPGLLYDLGQAYRLEGDCADARTAYRSYLRRAPHSPYRDLAMQHLSELGGCLRVVQSSPPPLEAPRVDFAPTPSARAKPTHRNVWLGIAVAAVGVAAGAAAYAGDL
jgi:tetratricopeptide (TPR) repeat protein